MEEVGREVGGRVRGGWEGRVERAGEREWGRGDQRKCGAGEMGCGVGERECGRQEGPRGEDD